MKYFIIFIISFLFPFYLFDASSRAQIIVWSVGQGQMVTYSDFKICVHFDMGGERFPVKAFVKECGHKANQVFFSHWDWDHINFVRKAWRRLSRFCRLNWPGGTGDMRKKQFLSVLPLCQNPLKEVFKELVFPAHLNKDKKATLANKYSRVVVVKNQVLIPGDSPGSSEPLWQNQLPSSIHVLVVSHHGSRYSTTEALLNHLPHLEIAVASARKKRYGHPHPLVKQRLKRHQVPLLSTEDFQHISIPLKFTVPKKVIIPPQNH